MNETRTTGIEAMKTTAKMIFSTKCLLLFLVFLLPGATFAQSPWQWQMSLKVETAGDSMYMPSAVGFDVVNERYYVIDTGRNRLVSFGRDGKLIRAFTANDQLKAPFDMVRLDNGQLWVVEKGRNSLTLIDLASRKIEPRLLKDGGHQIFPDRIAHFKNKLYVLDRSLGQVLRLDSNLAVEQRFGCSDCTAGMADFVVVDGQVVALEPRDRKVFRFNSDGSVASEFSLGNTVEFPVSLAVGPSGFTFVLDRHQNSVAAYDEQGQFRYRFLSIGHSAGKVYFPRQLRFDPWGRLCLVDEGNGRVEVFAR
jgi:DNA-binding beta-propeller fold protein YncE